MSKSRQLMDFYVRRFLSCYEQAKCISLMVLFVHQKYSQFLNVTEAKVSAHVSSSLCSMFGTTSVRSIEQCGNYVFHYRLLQSCSHMDEFINSVTLSRRHWYMKSTLVRIWNKRSNNALILASVLLVLGVSTYMA